MPPQRRAYTQTSPWDTASMPTSSTNGFGCIPRKPRLSSQRSSRCLLKCSARDRMLKCAAAIMSLIQSARNNGHDPYAYLKDVLTRLPTQRASEIAELLPQGGIRHSRARRFARTLTFNSSSSVRPSRDRCRQSHTPNFSTLSSPACGQSGKPRCSFSCLIAWSRIACTRETASTNCHHLLAWRGQASRDARTVTLVRAQLQHQGRPQ